MCFTQSVVRLEFPLDLLSLFMKIENVLAFSTWLKGRKYSTLLELNSLYYLLLAFCIAPKREASSC